MTNQVTVFQQAKNEPCLLANPLVQGELGLRFYAAAPLKTRQGLKIGALCIVDKKPRDFSELDHRVLANLAALVMEEIERYLGRTWTEEPESTKLILLFRPATG